MINVQLFKIWFLSSLSDRKPRLGLYEYEERVYWSFPPINSTQLCNAEFRSLFAHYYFCFCTRLMGTYGPPVLFSSSLGCWLPWKHIWGGRCQIYKKIMTASSSRLHPEWWFWRQKVRSKTASSTFYSCNQVLVKFAILKKCRILTAFTNHWVRSPNLY